MFTDVDGSPSGRSADLALRASDTSRHHRTSSASHQWASLRTSRQRRRVRRRRRCLPCLTARSTLHTRLPAQATLCGKIRQRMRGRCGQGLSRDEMTGRCWHRGRGESRQGLPFRRAVRGGRWHGCAPNGRIRYYRRWRMSCLLCPLLYHSLGWQSVTCRRLIWSRANGSELCHGVVFSAERARSKSSDRRARSSELEQRQNRGQSSTRSARRARCKTRYATNSQGMRSNNGRSRKVGSDVVVGDP